MIDEEIEKIKRKATVKKKKKKRKVGKGKAKKELVKSNLEFVL